MPYGLVDDKLHSHVKWRRATKGARALWATALSWCSDHPSDGFVPADMLRALDGTNAEASCLVRVGLWDQVPGGWIFHEWSERNPDAASVRAKRDKESKAGREGNHRRWHVKKGIRVDECEFCIPEPSGTPSGPRSGLGIAPESSPTPTPSTSSYVDPPTTSDASENGAEPTPAEMMTKSGLQQEHHRGFLRSIQENGGVSPLAIVKSGWREGTLEARVDLYLDALERAAKAPRAVTSSVTPAPRDGSGRAVYVPRLCPHDGEIGRCPMCRESEGVA